jgi:hypothetical protein
MYFERLQQKVVKPCEIFTNFNLFIYGGVNFEPYRAKFENLIGRKVDSIELFPASEDFCLSGFSEGKRNVVVVKCGHIL